MKNKGLVLGVMLIIGLFVLSPVSAAKVIDSGHKTIYSEKYDAYADYSWKTYKTSKYYITVYLTAKYETGLINKVKIIIKNVKPHKIKFTYYMTTDGKKSTKVLKYKSYGHTALWWYNQMKYDLHNP
jgi:hypothetical protein